MVVMGRQPRGDKIEWASVLAHRPADTHPDVIGRFEAARIEPKQVHEVLCDAGDALYAAALAGGDDWAELFGGPLAVALLAAEVSALAAHLNSRASALRALAVNALLDEFSAVTVGAHLGVSRQKVYEIGRGEITNSYIEQTPWRRA
jgi:hypothetical protein